MNLSKCKRIVFSRATGGLLAIGLLLLLNATPQVAHADPEMLYVSPTGSGTACSQVNPCTLHTALDIAESNGEDDVIYLAAGTHEGNFSCSPQDGRSLIIRGETGTTAEDVILDGMGTGRVLVLYGSSAGSSIRLEGLTIQNGNFPSHGGGIYLRTWQDEDVNIEIWDSIIRHNQAGSRGGGVRVHSYGGNSRIDLLIVNTLVYENQANWSGGGVEITASEVGDDNVTSATIINSTITNNTADLEGAGYLDYLGGGVRVYAYSGNGAVASLDLYNTIVYGNTVVGGGEGQDLYVGEWGLGNGTVNAYHSDIGDAFIDNSLGTPTYNPVNVINADPAFVDPENDDYHLSTGSSCEDEGTSEVPDPPGLPSTDFEGDPRISGVAPDIGADELGSGSAPGDNIYLPIILNNH